MNVGTEPYRLLKKRHVIEEIERLRVAVANTTGRIVAKALADSQGIGQDDLREQVSPALARRLAKRRGEDDDTRAVVSMAYVMAGMVEGLEMALGRLPVPMSLKKTKVFKDKETGEIMRQETTEEVKVFQTDIGAAKGMASELAKILLPSGDSEEGQTIEAITEQRKAYIDRVLAAYRDRTPMPPPMIEPRKT